MTRGERGETVREKVENDKVSSWNFVQMVRGGWLFFINFVKNKFRKFIQPIASRFEWLERLDTFYVDQK